MTVHRFYAIANNALVLRTRREDAPDRDTPVASPRGIAFLYDPASHAVLRHGPTHEIEHQTASMRSIHTSTGQPRVDMLAFPEALLRQAGVLAGINAALAAGCMRTLYQELSATALPTAVRAALNRLVAA